MSKLGNSLRAVSLHSNELGHLRHKPMWVMPDGSVAVKDGIELIVLGMEDFFQLLHHGAVDSLGIHHGDDKPIIFDDIGSAYASWPPPMDGVEKDVSWSGLVEAELEDPPGMSVDSASSDGLADPPKLGEALAESVRSPFSPATEARVHTQVSDRITPIPIVVGIPEVNHPVFKYLKEKDGTIPFPILGENEYSFRSVSYKRVRIGALSYSTRDGGMKEIEMDANRIDISTGTGPSAKRIKPFSLFS